MAVDTRDKRMSMITLCSPVPMVLPNPDGAIGTPDRAMLLWLYHGITLLAITTAAIVDLTLATRSVMLTLISRAPDALTLAARADGIRCG